MNLDGIKYIFQIPLAWFRQVGAFVFNSYGGNLVQINRNVDGSAEIFVDPNELKQQAQEGLDQKFVTLDTTQTITSAKTITGNDLTIGTGGYGLKVTDGAGRVLTMRGYGGTAPGFVMYLGGNANKSIIVAGDANDAMSIGAGVTGNLTIGGSGSGYINLGKAPDDSTSTSTLRVATMGWVNSKFFRPATNQTGLVYNTNGTISYKSIGTGANDVAAGQHTHTASDITDLPSGISPYTSTPAALSTNGSAGSSDRYSRGDHSHPLPKLEDLKYTEGGHTGTCLVIVDNSGNVTHSGNNYFNTLKWLTDRWDSTNSLLSTIQTKNTSNDQTIVYAGYIGLFRSQPLINFYYNRSGSYTSRIIESASGRLQLVSPNHAYLSVHPTDTDLDTTDNTATSKQIATCGFVNGKVTASDPSTTIQTMPASGQEDSTTALQDNWTAGGTNGLVRTVLYRQVFDSSATPPVIYNFYRTETLDKFGRVYQVSGETRKILDTTNLITLS